MRYLQFPAAALLGIISVHAMAQTAASTEPKIKPAPKAATGLSEPRSMQASNIVAADTHSEIAPALPSPKLGPDAGPRDYLQAAHELLAAGRTGEAQQALEMAETRLLDRSVVQGQGGTPSDSPKVAEIREALKALGNGDRHHAMDLIDHALAA
jgi:hypothetical protein